jgi:hypothetical protein
MPSDPQHHRARLDGEGNIILPGMGGTKDDAPLPEFEGETVLELELPEPPTIEEDFHPTADETDLPPEEAINLPGNWNDEVDFDGSGVQEYLTVILQDAPHKEISQTAGETSSVIGAMIPTIRLPQISVPLPSWTQVRDTVRTSSQSVLTEGSRQYQATFAETKVISITFVVVSGNLWHSQYGYQASATLPSKKPEGCSLSQMYSASAGLSPRSSVPCSLR